MWSADSIDRIERSPCCRDNLGSCQPRRVSSRRTLPAFERIGGERPQPIGHEVTPSVGVETHRRLCCDDGEVRPCLAAAIHVQVGVRPLRRSTGQCLDVAPAGQLRCDQRHDVNGSTSIATLPPAGTRAAAQGGGCRAPTLAPHWTRASAG